MKIFKVDFGWFSSEPEGCILLAGNENEAEKIIKEEFADRDRKKVEKEILEANPNDRLTFSIEEIPFKKGVIYTGYYCC